MIDTDTIVNYVADSLSDRWSVTTKPNTPTFVKLTDVHDNLRIINTNQIVHINRTYGEVHLTSNAVIRITSESMFHLLSVLDYS